MSSPDRKTGHLSSGRTEALALLDFSHDAVIVRDAQTAGIRFWNRAAEELYGWTGAEVLGRSAHALLQTRFPEPLAEIEAHLHRTGGWEGELIHTTCTGTTLSVASRWILIQHAGDGTGTVLEFNADLTLRRRAERRAHDFLEAAPDAIVLVEAGGRMAQVNGAAEQLFGYGRDQLIGAPLEILLPERFRKLHARHRTAYQRSAQRRGMGCGHEVWARRADGSEFPAEVRLNVVEAPGGPLIMADVRDVSEYRHAERQRAARFAVTRIIAQSSSFEEAKPQLLAAICQALNWDFAEMWRPDPRSGTLRLDCTHGMQGPELALFEDLSRATEFPAGVGLPGQVLATKSPAWISDLGELKESPRAGLAARAGIRGAFAFPLTGGDGIAGVILLGSRDQRAIDNDLLVMAASLGSQIGQFWERSRAEEERDRFFTLSLDLLCIADSDGYFRRINPAFEHTLGYPIEELTSRPFIEFVHPDDRSATVAETARLRTGTPSINFTNRFRCRDGTYRWLSWCAAPVPEEGRFYAAGHDITALKQVESTLAGLNEDLERRVAARTADLEATVKELEAFSYSVSHDLRAPLRAIDGFSRIVQEDFAAAIPEQGRHYLARMRENAQQLGLLIDDLLRFSRLGRQPLSRERVDPAGIARRALEDLSVERAGRSVEIAIGELPGCDADPALLKQVFVNLLSNALKYTRPRERGRIEVGAIQRDGETIYCVRDNGVGFDMRYADKLFGVFQRLHRAEEYEGTGVGLAIVQRIIHRHGGRVWADAAPDAGAAFYFTLSDAASSHD